MSIVNWMIDSFASDDIIDLYFSLTDLVDINLTEVEICENAYYDALATATVDEKSGEDRTPLGKLVL